MIMASSSNSLLFSSRSPSIPINSSSKLPIRLSSMIHSRRRQQQHPVAVLNEKSGAVLGFSGLVEKKGFGCSSHLLQRNSWFGSIRRRCNKGWGSEGEGDFDFLEAEILEFMDCFENPDKFHTKKDLINAGRGDLAEAIEKNRYWLWKKGGINNGCREKETDINGSSEMSAELGTGVSTDNIVVQKIANETGEERSQNWFRDLELELASTLRLLKSVSEIDTSAFKGSDSASDEFQETKGMNAKNKLRSIRAELAILEGKITLYSESQKNLEIKQKRINESPSDEFLELSVAWGETEVMNAKNKLRAIRAKLMILEGLIALVAIKNDYEDYCKLGSSMSAETGNDVATDNIVVQKISNETGEDKTKTETWWRSYVNANRRELYANLKLINPEFQPPEEGRDDSEPFFYDEAERRYYYFVKDLATAVKESLKQLMMLLMVVPLSFIILAFALKDKVGVVMKTVFHDNKLSSQEQEDSDIPASDVKV